jgi:BatD DUF11 like domain
MVDFKMLRQSLFVAVARKISIWRVTNSFTMQASSSRKRGLFSQKMLITFCLVVSMVPAAAADINVSVDRNPVGVNESFQLIFTADSTPDDDPDFKPLENDFEILNQAQSSNFSMINGAFSKSVKWTLTLMPKQAGKLIIPSIAFGRDATQALSITVNDSPDLSIQDARGEDLFLQVEAAPKTPYVQSQVIYTLRLYRKVNITQARLSDPELEDAVIEKIGEDRNYNTQYAGENYVVTERQYAIFPQQSGVVTIAPVELTAEVLVNSRSRFNGFFNRQTTRTKRVISKPITLDVKPEPAEFTGQHWLPAKELILKEEWSGDIQQMRPGEPLTRTLIVLAKGTTVGQLPDLNSIKAPIASPSGGELKSYPDQPMLKEQQKEDGIIALREEKIALIPSASGHYKLPEIKIPWWKTETQKMEIARIPGTTLTAVAPAAGEKEIEKRPVTPLAIEGTAPAQDQEHKIQPIQQNVWFWIAIIAVCGWFATIIYFLRKRIPEQPGNIDNKTDMRLKNSIKALKQACRNNDAAAAKDALIQWGREQWHESGLKHIALHCSDELKTEILALNRILYGTNSNDWHGDRLLKAFKDFKMDNNADKTDTTGLQPLYKA